MVRRRSVPFVLARLNTAIVGDRFHVHSPNATKI
jgi:hypothetical protein